MHKMHCRYGLYAERMTDLRQLRALVAVVEHGMLGETYCIGGRAERRNLAVVETVCDLLDERRPGAAPRRGLIRFVADRPGHDQRYAIDCSKIERELGWRQQQSFESGIAATIDWYRENEAWWRGQKAATEAKYRAAGQ